MQSVMVCGGAGFIGSHTTLALKEAGAKVVVCDNLSTGHHDTCFGDAFVQCDISDTNSVRQAMRDHNVGGVVHFAALIEAGESVVDPLPFYQNNVAETVALLQAMRAEGVDRFVFSSTAAVYGNHDGGARLDETLPRAPINPYGHSKSMVETILETSATAYGLKSVALRYFNAAGADSQGRTGERHTPETHLIPLVIQAALGQRPDIKIYGTDYDTPDGTCIRDYIHVSDLARAHVAALDFLETAPSGTCEAMNLGTGEGYSVRAVIDAVKKASGRAFDVVETPRRPGDPDRLVADASRAREKLGWVAQDSSLDQIVEDAWRFFSNQS